MTGWLLGTAGCTARSGYIPFATDGDADGGTEPPPRLRIASTTVTEGDVATIHITLDSPALVPVTATVVSADGDAVAGRDFVAVNETIRIGVGDSGTTLQLVTLNDADECETVESLTLVLSDVVGAEVAAATASIRIEETDFPTYSVSDSTQSEGAVADFTVVFAQACTSEVTFDWAVRPGTAALDDVGVVRGSVTIPQGQVSATFRVPLVDDGVAEGDEWFLVRLKGGPTAAGNVPISTGHIVDSAAAGQAIPIRVTAGARHTCALFMDGRAKCWGDTSDGALGRPASHFRDEASELLDPWPAVALGSGAQATQLVAGGNFSCALLVGGEVKCWGDNGSGQLGQASSGSRGDHPGEMGDNLPPIDLGSGFTVQSLSAGADHVCAVSTAGQVKCWGSNQSGALGYGDSRNRGGYAGSMGDSLALVEVGGAVAALSLGSTHSCALLVGGAVKCWGSNGYGKLGYGHTDALGDEPGEMGANLPVVDLGPGRSAQQVSAGLAQNTCALLDDGSTKCWGYGWNGACGLGGSEDVGDEPGEMGNALPVVPLDASAGVASLASGSGFNCAVRNDGAVLCWGAGWGGRLGNGATTAVGTLPGQVQAIAPVLLGTGRTATRVAAGFGFACALLDDASVKCWGNNAVGQLGIGHTHSIGDQAGEMGDALPALFVPATTAVEIGAGSEHACLRTVAGAVHCWGANREGQLGTGTAYVGDAIGEMGSNLPFVDIGAGAIEQLVSGYRHTCALLSGGTVKCWGSAEDGGAVGLGVGGFVGDQADELGSALPQVNLGTNARALLLTAGGSHTCALLDSFDVVCWGSNYRGQSGTGGATLGDGPGEMGDALPRVDLGAAALVVGLSAGLQHTCALLQDDRVKCWGANFNGELGLEDTTPRGDRPDSMGDLLPAVALGSGFVPASVYGSRSSTCVLSQDGRVKCFGAGTYGELGTEVARDVGDAAGSMGDALVFANLGTGVQAIELSGPPGGHTCARLADGGLKCWGSNSSGQLGTGDRRDRGSQPGSMGDTLAAIPLPTSPVMHVAIGHSVTCAVTGDNAVYCWGANGSGQLGLGHTASVGDNAGEMGAALQAVDLGP